MAGLRDKLISEAMERKEYLEHITSKKVSSKTFQGKSYKVPDDPTRDVDEAIVLKECKQLLDKIPGLWWARIEAQGKLMGGRMIRSTMKGLPDLIFCIAGRLHGVELKRSRGGVLEPEQAWKLGGIQASGGRVAVVRSADGLSRMLSGSPASAVLTTVHGPIEVF